MNSDQYVSFEEFSRLEMRIGTIISVERIPDTDKLYKLQVDFGIKPSSLEEGSSDQSKAETDVEPDKDIRTIVSGIADRVEADYLVGKQCPFVTNLAPRTIRGVESNGMIMAASVREEFALLHPHQPISNGSSIK